jgi:hypothetical protein
LCTEPFRLHTYNSPFSSSPKEERLKLAGSNSTCCVLPFHINISPVQ